MSEPSAPPYSPPAPGSQFVQAQQQPYMMHQQPMQYQPQQPQQQYSQQYMAPQPQGQYYAGQPQPQLMPAVHYQPVAQYQQPAPMIMQQQQQPPMQQGQYAQPQTVQLINNTASHNSPGALVAAMAPPVAPAGTPPGLEYFQPLDRMWVLQQLNLVEQLSGWNMNQKYQCVNAAGQQVYWAEEESGCCSRQCLGSMRPFLIKCFDPANRPVMKLSRPYRCNSPWCLVLPINCCCLQEMEVRDIHDGLIGTIRQRFALLYATWDLYDAHNVLLLTIKAPFCVSSCCGDIKFDLLGPPHGTSNAIEVIGAITRKWRGIIKELVLPDVDKYECTFPQALNITAKALVFAATFLLDFMYFEHKENHRSQPGVGGMPNNGQSGGAMNPQIQMGI